MEDRIDNMKDQKPRDCIRDWDAISGGQWIMLVKGHISKNSDTFDWVDLREGGLYFGS